MLTRGIKLIRVKSYLISAENRLIMNELLENKKEYAALFSYEDGS